MNQAFCNFSNTAVSEGLVGSQPSLGSHLATTRETFLRLSRDANIGSDETQEDVDKDSVMPNVTNDSYHNTLDSLQVDTGIDHPSLSAFWSSEDRSEPSSSTFGLTLDSSSDDSRDIMHNAGYEPDYTINSDGQSPPNWMSNKISEWNNGQRSGQSLANLYASTFPHKFIKPPTTYSFHESTFARRLFRLSIENGLRLLKDPRSSPSQLKYKFKFTFCFTSRAALIDRLTRRLAASNNENLEAWSSPRFHIGGSGLHYPRPEINNDMTPPPENWWSEPIGPPQWQDPEDLSYKDHNIVECIKHSGLDGEWFDANDVDQYLRTKGVFLDSGSSYAEIPLSAVSASPVSSTNSPILALSEPTDESLPSPPGLPQKRDFAWMDDTTFPNIPMSSTSSFEDFNDPVFKDFGLYPPPHHIFADTYPSAPFVRKATLDVGQFLHGSFSPFPLLVCPGRRKTNAEQE